MIERCIMIFPEFNNSHEIDQLRNLYDPLANLVKPHITLVFPFESEILTSELGNHIKKALEDYFSFELKLEGIVPTTVGGNYLFLNVVDGNEEIVSIHKQLYSSILKRFHNHEIPYVPHMTVGRIDDDSKYKEAILMTRNFSSVFKSRVNRISVEVIGPNGESTIEYEYKLRN